MRERSARLEYGLSYVTWYGGDRNQRLGTPARIFDALHAEFVFTLDGAADGDNALLPNYGSVDSPHSSWRGERVFCNPPWSGIRPFIDLAATAELAVLLVPARTNARWFHAALDLGADVRFFLGKPRFGNCKHTSPVDCLLLIFNHGIPIPHGRT